MKKISPALFISLFLSAATYSQSTFEFMRLDMSARAGALAGSFVSNNDDPDVIFYNPAGVALLEGSPVSFSFMKHLLDINLASLSYSMDFEDVGRFAAAVKYINYGSFDGRSEFGAEEAEFGAGEVAFIIGYANELDQTPSAGFYYGLNAKFIYSGIREYYSTAVAFDAGLHYQIPSENINIGFSVLNVGKQLSEYISAEEELPLDIIIGISKKLEYLPLRLSLDFHKLNEDRNDFIEKFKAFTVGAEFTLSRVLRLRFGYDNEKRNELKIGSFAGIAGFNAGLGIIIKQEYRFDYGFSSMGSIGDLHRISVSTTL